MRIRITLLAVACVVSGLLLTIAYHPQGPVTTPKTDRLAGQTAGPSFLAERFDG